MRFQRTASTTNDAPVGAELVPDGEHVCDVVAVKEWASKKDGREAVILTLQPVDPRYAHIEKWLDPTSDRDAPLVVQLGDLLGQDGDEVDISEETCKGLRVKVKAKNGIRQKDGVAVVYVNAFSEAPQPAAAATQPVWQANAQEQAKKAAKRTNSQKATASLAEPNDDIPF